MGLRFLRKTGVLLLASAASYSGSGLRSARAQAWEETAERFQLRWVREGGAESCVSGVALARLLEQTLGVQQATPGTPKVLLEGRARSAPGPLRFSVAIDVRDAQSGDLIGERELTTSDVKCSALTPALLLVLAMSIDPEAGRASLPPAVVDELKREPAEETDAAPTTSLAPSSPILPQITAKSAEVPVSPLVRQVDVGAPVEPARPAAEIDLSGGVAVSAGVLPSIAMGASLGGRIPLRRGWSLSLALLGWLPQRVPLEVSPYLLTDSVRLDAAQLAAGLCRGFVGDRLEVGACAGLNFGVRWVSATALANRDNLVRPFYGPELGLEASWRLAPSWFVSVGVNGDAALTRERITYLDHFRQTRIIFEPSRYSGSALLSLGARL